VWVGVLTTWFSLQNLVTMRYAIWTEDALSLSFQPIFAVTSSAVIFETNSCLFTQMT
jgi:hypothetical protein